MEHRQLGTSGFMVPVLSLGTGTFGGQGAFKGFGETDAAEATRLVDICVDTGLTMFDSADAYSAGMAEEILGHAIKGRRDKVIISTKSAFRVGPGPNDVGSSRYHLIRAVEGSLKRLGTDFIDLYQLHAFDRTTPVEETLGTLDDLVKAGKIRYIGCSNFSGWHLMKSLAISKEYGLARYVAHQAYYSLVGRDYEWELMPLGARPWGRLRRVEPTRICTVDGQNPPRQGPARDESLAQQRHHRGRPRRRRRLPVPRGRRTRRCGRGNRQDRVPGGDQLGAPAPKRRNRHHWRAHRRAASSESGSGRMGTDARAGRPA